MRTIFLVVLLACGKTSSPTPDNTGSATTTTGGTPTAVGSPAAGSAAVPAASNDSFDKAIVALEDFRTKMCACKDVPCVEKVQADFQLWRMELKKTTAGQKPTKDQDQRGNAIDRAMKECRTAVISGSRPATGAGSAPVPADPFDAALVEVEGFSKKMCACKDKACADTVQVEFATYQRALRAKLTGKPSALQDLRGKALDKEMRECRAKAEAATPGPPGGADKIDAMLAKMTALRDKLCACSDKPCLAGVEKELEVWTQGIARELADAKPTKDQDAKADKLAAEMKACKLKVK
jgi:hypothetical protein